MKICLNYITYFVLLLLFFFCFSINYKIIGLQLLFRQFRLVLGILSCAIRFFKIVFSFFLYQNIHSDHRTHCLEFDIFPWPL